MIANVEREEPTWCKVLVSKLGKPYFFFFNTLLANFNLTWSYMNELRGTLCIVSGRIWAGAGPASSSALCGNSTSSLSSHLTPWPRRLQLMHLAFFILKCWRLEALKFSPLTHSAIPLQNLVMFKIRLFMLVDFSATCFPFREI